MEYFDHGIFFKKTEQLWALSVPRASFESERDKKEGPAPLSLRRLLVVAFFQQRGPGIADDAVGSQTFQLII